MTRNIFQDCPLSYTVYPTNCIPAPRTETVGQLGTMCVGGEVIYDQHGEDQQKEVITYLRWSTIVDPGEGELPIVDPGREEIVYCWSWEGIDYCWSWGQIHLLLILGRDLPVVDPEESPIDDPRGSSINMNWINLNGHLR